MEALGCTGRMVLGQEGMRIPAGWGFRSSSWEREAQPYMMRVPKEPCQGGRQHGEFQLTITDSAGVIPYIEKTNAGTSFL